MTVSRRKRPDRPAPQAYKVFRPLPTRSEYLATHPHACPTCLRDDCTEHEP